MIRATYPVLALFTGSVQSLTRSLSPVDWVPAEGSPPIGRRQLFSRGKPLPHLPTCPFSSRIHHPTLQKAIQFPETCPGSVQWILSEVLRPGHSVAPRHPSAGALPIESVSLSVACRRQLALLRFARFSAPPGQRAERPEGL